MVGGSAGVQQTFDCVRWQENKGRHGPEVGAGHTSPGEASTAHEVLGFAGKRQANGLLLEGELTDFMIGGIIDAENRGMSQVQGLVGRVKEVGEAVVLVRKP